MDRGRSHIISHGARLGAGCLAAFLLLLALPANRAQEPVDPLRAGELRRVRDELALNDSFRDADLRVTIGERALFDGLRRLEGLEVVLSNGSILRLTSIDGSLKPGAGIVRVGLQAESKVRVNLVLTGRIQTGESGQGVFHLPLKITDVSLKNGPFSTIFLKTFFGEWLSAARWNEFLSEIDLPAEIEQALQIPAGRFEVRGSMPMVIDTPRYTAPLKFRIVSIVPLEGRAVAALRIVGADRADDGLRASDQPPPGSLEQDIERLSSGLGCAGSLCLRLGRDAISRFLEGIAAAESRDLEIELRQGRIRSEQVEAVVKFTNYTDVEGGKGYADIQALGVDGIDAGRIGIRLTASGEVDARLRGREYGIPYRASPRTTFSIRDSLLPFQFESEGERVVMKAAPGTVLTFSLRFNFPVAGRSIGFNRSMSVQADQWFRRLELPPFIGRELELPRRIEVDAGGNYFVTKKQKLVYTLSRLLPAANNGAVDIMGDLAFELK